MGEEIKRSLIRFTEDPHRPLWEGILLAVTMFTTSELSSLMQSHYFYLMYRVGTRVQTCLTAAVYRKVQQMWYKDERTKMVNEVLNGIKVIKLYAWEPPMEKVINGLREKELALIRRAALLRTLSDMFNSASPFLVALSTFATFIMLDPKNVLTPEIAFVSLTLFNQLRTPMSQVAEIITQTVQVVVSNRRLTEFLISDELSPFCVDNGARDREMDKLHGYIGLTGRVSYVPQQPWMQNQTIRQNITFGKKFDEYFYNRVLDACALYPDLQMLPLGDMTEIGEKGINLSGGQKARISLARAVYQNHDVYLLDDPMSAVDSHVGAQLFSAVIGPEGMLRNKTRILVTNELAFLKHSDHILIMKSKLLSIFWSEF
ncbi:ABC transporter, ATP-binding protein [Ancylostoma ceylanicum]|uniref:ABC transporter, ATP-binding protein n=1 Tax=Ancylostoma ceylanicum TaxID=53326 RepID=A0A0D6LWN3_9BILA|nr:ABC transporter, ATP-binding protein [Ancylostoma ceylanicum]